MADHETDLDLGLARQVQKILFPKTAPTYGWGEIGIMNRMAGGVGGDYFDFLPMSDGCQVIFLGDVTGCGLHASLIMALIYGYIHRAFDTPCPCQDIVTQLNDFLLSFATRSEEFDQFFSSTLFYAIINPETRKVTYVNAGHPPPLVRRGKSIFSLAATSPPLGFFAMPDISTRRMSLEKGDRLLLYTDGITEATNCEGVSFGRERVEDILRQTTDDHMELLDNLIGSLTIFTEKELQKDDCTAIIIDFHGYE